MAFKTFKFRPPFKTDSTTSGLIAAATFGLAAVVPLVSASLSGWTVVAVFALASVAGTLTWKALRQRHVPVEADSPDEAECDPVQSEPPTDPNELVEQMLEHDRYALLLRAEVLSNLAPEQVKEAWSRLQDGMTLVPQGEITIGTSFDPSEEEDDDRQSSFRHKSAVVCVDQLFLDRYVVTNRQYQQFINAGGYTQMGLWEPQIWPGVLDFVDGTGHSAPRFWKNGTYSRGEDDLPVVGVSWYEASAFARWVGKRLPTDPEWEKAGSWPVEMSATNRPQRQYPWGNAMDRERCNLWGSGPSQRVAVDRYPNGASVGGAVQLVGNVWEWTSGHFSTGAYARRDLILPTPMRSVRGGAFDTYFENQATCQFQSGDDPVARRHNIGFRCAVSMCDVALPAANAAMNPDAAIPETAIPETATSTASASEDVQGYDNIEPHGDVPQQTPQEVSA